MAHLRRPRPDCSFSFRAKVFETRKVDPSSLKLATDARAVSEVLVNVEGVSYIVWGSGST